MKIRNLILLLLGLFSLSIARGERVPEWRKDATHVVVGEVTKIFKSDGKEYVGYVVRIQVEALEKGTGPAKGQHFYAECFERKPHSGPGTPAPGASGHSGVPKVGDRVRIFTNEKKAIYEGVYPNWYDVLPKVDESPEERERGMKLTGGDLSVATKEDSKVWAQPIPDKPAAGKVQGREFKVEEATLKEGCLKLRQGEGFSSHLEEFEIDLSRKKVENFSGKTFTVELNQKAGIDITLAYSGERKGSIKTRTYLGDYTMKLEFGAAKDGKLPGKIHLRLPDEAGSFVVGTFEAETK